MAPSFLDKQKADCDSPHDWLMSLAMNLTTLCHMWRWKWHRISTNGCHLAVISEDVAFARHFMAFCLPPPYRSTSGIGYTSPWITSYRFVEIHMQMALFILAIYWIEYFKIIFLNIYNCVYKTLFASPVTYDQLILRICVYTQYWQWGGVVLVHLQID